jgi:hypothetical protein
MNMEERLKKLLIDFRYESSQGWGQKRLQPYHIEALMKDLVPFIKKEVTDTYISCGRFQIKEESDSEKVKNDPWLNL